ncbi:winged-helix domain-containing protein [Halopenitus persicus]|uniref:winged-helix domain-containing protein n=1 Tax=Halopenitus persicus TaxID=1048396 RepID=UPI000BBAAA0A|nr:winged-helix domain-containing protein [Halopenitus persicus]
MEDLSDCDKRILAEMEEAGLVKPEMIAEELDEYHPQYVRDRMRTLDDRGLVHRHYRGVYEITEAAIGALDEARDD